MCHSFHVPKVFATATCFLLLIPWCGGQSQSGDRSGIDASLQKQIDAMVAIDNHAHPVLPPPNDKTDREYDALPVDHLDPETDPVGWRADNPQLEDAWSHLWGFHATVPLDPSGQGRLNAARERVRAREGEHYATWLLDQTHIGAMLANRVAMGAGLERPRFVWVPYLDCLLFPLDNSKLASRTPDRSAFFPLEDKLRARYLSESGLSALPATLPDYLRQVVAATLERQKAGGAVAVKFEVGYLRSFAFGDPSEEDAARVYAAAISSHGSPRDEDYKTLQDFLFRYIAAECGRLGLPVLLHGMAGGGSYYNVAGSNPLLLEPLFDDRRLRQTRFVILHGGWPFVHEIGALLQKPNVYLDISQQALIIPPRTLATWLREWLELYPDKVLFGTDGYPFSEYLGWEESLWIANRNAREALAYALTGMMEDGEIDRTRATHIAREVLSGNAAALYRLPQP
ncbi:MAG TPA: amidohydrolase family protein [Acidobacteriaceae bacterium]|nr:amidohydrolase family protein [Acidobacteriaceae bacterium]